MCVCVKAALLTCFVFLPRCFFGVFVFRSSLSCSGLAGKFDAVLTCLLGMSSRHVYFYPERNMNGLMKLHWDSLILDLEFLGGTLASHFLAEVGTNVCSFAIGTVRANMTASMSRSSFAQTCSCACLLAVYGFACLRIFRSHDPCHVSGLAYMFWFSGHPCHVSGLAYMFWFLIVWHVCYPVISVMCRSCRRVLRNTDLFVWHV